MKSSKYLKEQYEHFKSGLNISTLHPNSKKLLDFLKEYLEISDIGLFTWNLIVNSPSYINEKQIYLYF